MKINDLIKKLEEIKSRSGNLPVCISFNGCRNSGELMEITDFEENGAFPNKGEILFTCDYVPGKNQKVTKFLELYSNRRDFEAL